MTFPINAIVKVMEKHDIRISSCRFLALSMSTVNDDIIEYLGGVNYYASENPVTTIFLFCRVLVGKLLLVLREAFLTG